jgi:hypothetical protein
VKRLTNGANRPSGSAVERRRSVTERRLHGSPADQLRLTLLELRRFAASERVDFEAAVWISEIDFASEPRARRLGRSGA